MHIPTASLRRSLPACCLGALLCGASSAPAAQYLVSTSEAHSRIFSVDTTDELRCTQIG